MGRTFLVFDMRDLLVNAEKAKKQEALRYIEFWLNTVHLHTSSAPILLVGTFLDEIGIEKTKEIDLLLRKATSGIAAGNRVVKNPDSDLLFFPLDNASTEGIEMIREVTKAVTEKQSHVNKLVSVKWMKCLDRILATKRPWLPLEEVKSIAKICNITSALEINTMLELFHKLGVIFWLTSTDALKSIVTTNPSWLIDAVGKVIRDREHHMFDMEKIEQHALESEVERMFSKGIVSIDLLWHLWGEDAQIEFLLDLMRRSMLLSDWKYSGKDQEYLVPALIGNSEHSRLQYPVDIPGKCVFDFSETFLPTGVYERLVCLLVAQSVNQIQTYEPVLMYQSCKVCFGKDLFVFLHAGEKQLTLVVTKEREASKYLSMLLSMLNKIQFDAMNNSMSWNVKLWSAGEGQYVAYEDARKSRICPWFDKETAASYDNLNIKKNGLDDRLDLDTFLGSLG